MSGLRLNLILLLAGLITQACSKPSHVEGAPRFTLSHVTAAGDGSELSVNRRATRTWKDYDGDGLSDRKDPDIDDDGVPNLADQYPFDGKKIGEDVNANGVADFIDLNFHPTLKVLASLQEQIKNDLDIIVMNGSDEFSEAEVETMKETLFHEAIRAKLTYEELKVIVRYSKDDQLGENCADFDPFWRQISFYPNPDHQNNVLAFNGSFVHELGHVYASENPSELEQFATAFPLWVSPSLYGKSSAEEGFAENFVYQLYHAQMIKIDPLRFDNHAHN